MVRGCEYRGFMVHRGIEKLAESVLTYNDIPMMAERICGICGCVHNVAYAQAVETGRGPDVRRRAPNTSARSCWRSSACTATCSGSGWPATSSGFDTLFMQSFRIREPIMWIAEKISGNRKTYALCVIGGVRWDITPGAEGRAARRCWTSWRRSGAPWWPP